MKHNFADIFFLLLFLLNSEFSSSHVLNVLPIQNSTELRIVGGKDAKIEDFPWIVAIIKDKDGKRSFICGGSMIKVNKILTACHCFDGFNPLDTYIVYGSRKLSEGGTAIRPIKVSVHPSYVQKQKPHDICVMTLSQNIKLGPTAQLIEMNKDKNLVLQGNVDIAGWGYTDYEKKIRSNTLKKVTLPIIQQDYCRQRFGPVSLGHLITDLEICAGGHEYGKGACVGDSGGPLSSTVDGKIKLFGVASWGVACARGYPDVFARVSHYIKWINQQL